MSAEQSNPRFPPDTITPTELVSWFYLTDKHGEKHHRRAVQATSRAYGWEEETRLQIEAANNGDTEAQWVIAQVIAWRITR